MPQFSLQSEFDPREVPAAIGPFLAIVGFQSLRRRIEEMTARIRENNYAYSTLVERYTLELELWRLVSHFRKYNRLPATVRAGTYSPDLLRAYSFIWGLTKVYAFLDARAQKRLKGRIQHALTDEEDILAIDHELNIISHLSRFGCQITYHDLEGNGGYDFLAVRQGLEFEVECKMISADKGRQIHQHDVVKLGEHFQRAVNWDAVRTTRTAVLVRLHVPEKLPRRPELLAAIAKDVAQAAAGTLPQGRAEWRVERIPFAIESSPFYAWGQQLSMETVHDFVQGLTGLPRTKLLIFGREGESALLLSIESDKADQVLDHVYRELKHASKQLSGTRPGVIYTAFQDLMAVDVLRLAHATPNGFDMIAGRLFANLDRRHLQCITFMSQLGFRQTPDGGFTADGKVFRCFNSNHPLADDQRLRFDSDHLPC